MAIPESIAADAHGEKAIERQSVYVYEAPVRIWHWVNAFAILTLALTGYFIGSPGMNVLPVKIDGATAVIGDQTIALNAAPETAPTARVELGIRPEFVRLGREGMPVTISKVEDVGRHKVARALFAGQPLTIVVPEDDEIPADSFVTFDRGAINIYADSWRVKTEAV